MDLLAPESRDGGLTGMLGHFHFLIDCREALGQKKPTDMCANGETKKEKLSANSHQFSSSKRKADAFLMSM